MTKPVVVYLFAAFYLIVLTAMVFTNRIGTGDYFAQSALILTAIGLYHAAPPSSGGTT